MKLQQAELKDSSGQLTQPPFFKQAGDEVNPDSIKISTLIQKKL